MSKKNMQKNELSKALLITEHGKEIEIEYYEDSNVIGDILDLIEKKEANWYGDIAIESMKFMGEEIDCLDFSKILCIRHLPKK